MSVNYDADVNSIGGGLGGGLGGGGFLPWLFLLLLGKDGNALGGGNNGAAGVLAGETQAKLDCLSQGQANINANIQNAEQAERFNNISQQLTAAEAVNRAGQGVINDRINTIGAKLAECCCENLVGQQEIKTAIAMQTNALVVNEDKNAQRILDKINENALKACETDAANLRSQLNEQRVLTAVRENCGPSNQCNGGIDINVLARAMQGQSQS